MLGSIRLPLGWLDSLAGKDEWLRRAIEHDQLTVHYQPIVDHLTGRAVGVEALSRWNDPQFGTCHRPSSWSWPRRWESRWQSDLGQRAPTYLSVNLSARPLAGLNMVKTVLRTLETTGLPPRRLCLELTESVFMDEIEGAAGQLRDLCSLGVRLAMDDFETGYSSLLSLRRFPGEFLKIDRSFVAGSRTDPTSPAIVAAVVSLGALGLSPVAEGVEGADEANPAAVAGLPLRSGLSLRPPDARAGGDRLAAPYGRRLRPRGAPMTDLLADQAAALTAGRVGGQPAGQNLCLRAGTRPEHRAAGSQSRRSDALAIARQVEDDVAQLLHAFSS